MEIRFMRRHAPLFASAVLLFLLSSAPAHSAPVPGLGLPALHLDAGVGDVVLPLVGGLPALPRLGALHAVDGVVPGLVSGVVLPLVGALLIGDLSPLPGLEGVGGVVVPVVSVVGLPLVGVIFGGGI
jgi:hypothetical protein